MSKYTLFLYGLLIGFLLEAMLVRLDGSKPMDDFIYPAVLFVLMALAAAVRITIDRGAP